MAQTNSPLGEWLQKGGKILPFSVPSPLQKWRSVKSGRSFVRSINFVPLWEKLATWWICTARHHQWNAISNCYAVRQFMQCVHLALSVTERGSLNVCNWQLVVAACGWRSHPPSHTLSTNFKLTNLWKIVKANVLQLLQLYNFMWHCHTTIASALKSSKPWPYYKWFSPRAWNVPKPCVNSRLSNKIPFPTPTHPFVSISYVTFAFPTNQYLQYEKLSVPICFQATVFLITYFKTKAKLLHSFDRPSVSKLRNLR